MKKQSTLDGFLKRKHESSSQVPVEPPPTVIDANTPNDSVPMTDNPSKKPFHEMNDVDLNTLERDPSLRIQIYDYPVNQQDIIRRAYINRGPFQPILSTYPKSGPEDHKRSFQCSWFKQFPWLEYSQSSNAAKGIYYRWISKLEESRWEKCAFLQHIGTECTSFHNVAQKSYDDLLNEAQDIQNKIEKFTDEDRKKNRLRLKTIIYAVRWCAFQAIAFRGHNERPDSINKGNFLEMLEAICSFNNEMKELFRTAPKHASYTSRTIQKEILNLIANRVRRMICDEIDGGKFCLLVDEARDKSNREQMSIVLRFSIRGQGYDGASNMRGHFKRLQALISKDCSSAYYVHCFAHRLQLALMAASQGVIALQKFFTQLSFVINVVGASSKRADQLRDAQAEQMAYFKSISELETGRGLNQIGTLQRAGDTRWGSHLKSVSSLIKMFSPICEVLLKIIEDGTGSIRGDADSTYETITTFDFIFVLHLEKEIMEITYLLCQALQKQSQDILNALRLVAFTELLLQKIKDEIWDSFLSHVKSFCLERNIDIPNLSSSYFSRGARARNERSDHTLEHHYRVDIFIEAINCQLMELDHWFNDSSMELLHLSSTLDPKNSNEPFRSGDICQLVEKFYPEDFNETEKNLLKMQLQHSEADVIQHDDYKQLISISELCQWLIKTRRATNFYLIYRVVSLILTLPVSTATTERSFSAMSLVKTRLRNKMEDEFLNDSLVFYFERELAENITLETIVQDFKDAKDRRIPL
ncbi:uncharacterized protein LOC111890735 [Lactuca sativa]|uniref:uncharacterized protein LOC111890735 n=1 Tax=Lactuca sativa TaxID=4236 RepID=UPI000CD9C767|nr:uncharacterized protein LOC111890735 [Lactuca sativa]